MLEQNILCHVGILELIDQDVLELGLVFCPDIIGVLIEETEHLQQEIVKIHQIVLLLPFVISKSNPLYFFSEIKKEGIAVRYGVFQ